jgi:MFS family permease
MDFAHEIPGTYYSEYVIQLGGTPLILGAITFASMITLASVQFTGGYLADKYGRRWLISTLTFGVALSFVFFAVAPSWHFILAGAILQNICLLYQPALNAIMADSLPPEKRGLGFSVLNLITSVSTTPAPVAALFLVATFGSELGMRIAYTIVVLLYLAAATVRLKLKETLKNVEKASFKEAVRSYPKALQEGNKRLESCAPLNAFSIHFGANNLLIPCHDSNPLFGLRLPRIANWRNPIPRTAAPRGPSASASPH